MRWLAASFPATFPLLLTLVACSSGPNTAASPDGGADAGRTDDASLVDASEGGKVADAGPDAAWWSEGGACPSPLPPDPYEAKRAACTFTTGASVADTLGIPESVRKSIPIKNVIVMMKENRSFDHLLGRLHDQGRPAVEPIPPTFTNLDETGATVGEAHEGSTCVAHDPSHQWGDMHMQVDNGKMDGFVKSAALTTGTDGHFVFGYYEQADLPFYYWLASTFSLDDRHFASVRSGTYPNRNFLLLGTADGVMSTGAGFPDPQTPTLFDALDKAGVTWGVYSDGSLLSGTLNWTLAHKGTGKFADFLTKLDDGTLPQVTFVDGTDNVEDDHPTANLQQGEAWVHQIYAHATASKLWPGLALLWTYDEGGGFADHVPPPNKACIARPIAKDQPYFELGVRVPMVVISPYARKGYTSHVVEEHTAITRFIETVFDLPALTARDANSPALLDQFDFECPPFLTPPSAPQPGTGGCAGGVVLTSAQPNYTQSTPITLSFTGAPGNDPKDWIAIYAYPQSGPTPPGPGPLLFDYVGGMHTPSTSPAAGTVTFDATSVGSGTWPLPVGGYIAYYLLNDGYTSVASIDFNVTQ